MATKLAPELKGLKYMKKDKNKCITQHRNTRKRGDLIETYVMNKMEETMKLRRDRCKKDKKKKDV